MKNSQLPKTSDTGETSTFMAKAQCGLIGHPKFTYVPTPGVFYFQHSLKYAANHPAARRVRSI